VAAIRFETEPARYRHWRFAPEGELARLTLDVPDDGGLVPGYALKLNSYDLGVDIELADALQRVRFEHPAVRALAIESAKPRVFCSGANIYMLGSSSHAFKVNFCKYTNETRLYLEQLSSESGIPSLAALGGTASGGGYELALACDRILLQDDGASGACAGIWPTRFRRSPRACAAGAPSSGTWWTRSPRAGASQRQSRRPPRASRRAGRSATRPASGSRRSHRIARPRARATATSSSRSIARDAAPWSP
jgi:hypothetical protein